MTLTIGDKVPANWDQSAAYDEHIAPVMRELERLADEHDIALTLFVTAKCERTGSDDGYTEDATFKALSVNQTMHATVGLVLSALIQRCADGTALEPKDMMMAQAITQEMVQEILAGEATFK